MSIDGSALPEDILTHGFDRDDELLQRPVSADATSCFDIHELPKQQPKTEFEPAVLCAEQDCSSTPEETNPDQRMPPRAFPEQGSLLQSPTQHCALLPSPAPGAAGGAANAVVRAEGLAIPRPRINKLTDQHAHSGSTGWSLQQRQSVAATLQARLKRLIALTRQLDIQLLRAVAHTVEFVYKLDMS